MVNENTLLVKLKDTLEVDSTYKRLIDHHGDSSKIIFGDARPKINLPYVQFIITPNDIDFGSGASNILLLINIYSREMGTGLPDYEEIENIAERIDALFNDQTIVPASHNVFAIYTEERQTVIRDRDRDKTYIGGLRCRIHAVKY